MRTCGGWRASFCRSAAGVSPVRTATVSSWAPLVGGWRLSGLDQQAPCVRLFKWYSITRPPSSMWKIGPCRIAHPVTLAPMEEHTNFPFRVLMKQFGASLVCTERVDAVDVARRDRRAMRLLHCTSAEGPRAGQISGADPAVMAEAARVVEECGFSLVDLNFECPIRRLINRGEGGALLADPPAIGRIVAAVVSAVRIPVTLKIRSGPHGEQETASQVARCAE